RWSVNSMMMTFVAFSVVLVLWVLWGFKFAFGSPQHLFGIDHGIFANLWGKPGAVLGHLDEQGQAAIPLITSGPPFHFPTSTLVYFQLVFAAITPLLMLGSVLGRFNFKAWIPSVLLWSTLLYTGNAFNGGDPYYAGASASSAVLNTNLATACALLTWVGLDYLTRRKPSLIGTVNGMIAGLVAITPAAGYVNGWGAGAIGIIGVTI